MKSVFLAAAELKGSRPLPKCCVVCGSAAKRISTSFAIHAEDRYERRERISREEDREIEEDDDDDRWSRRRS